MRESLCAVMLRFQATDLFSSVFRAIITYISVFRNSEVHMQSIASQAIAMDPARVVLPSNSLLLQV
jgi:hypothetical protein